MHETRTVTYLSPCFQLHALHVHYCKKRSGKVGEFNRVSTESFMLIETWEP